MLLKNLWECNCNEPILGIELFDFTQTNQLLIAYSKRGNLVILSNDGQLFLKEKISENTPIWRIKVCDIDNDGNLEIIIGGMDGILRVYKIHVPLVLNFFWSHKFSSSISGILMKDINNDGKSEVISYSLDKSIRLLNPINGDLIWGQVFEDGIEDAFIWDANESKSERQIIACGNDGTVRIFSLKNGDLLWFKRFTDKIRFVDYINSNKGALIVCGGDDKLLHFIDIASQEEIRNIEFDDYVWKCLSFPRIAPTSILVSSYSFDYLNHSKPLQNIDFTSKILCINQKLETVWELPNKNIESIHRFQTENQKLIAIGTTTGELLILDEEKGNIKCYISNSSCVNGILYESTTNLLITCHEDGLIKAYLLENF